MSTQPTQMMVISELGILGLCAVSMKKANHTTDEIDNVCTSIIELLKTGNPDSVMREADSIFKDCLSLTGNLKQAEVIPIDRLRK